MGEGEGEKGTRAPGLPLLLSTLSWSSLQVACPPRPEGYNAGSVNTQNMNRMGEG